MTIKLHRCSATWAKVGNHPCHRVETALDDMGLEYELVKEGYGYPKSRRTRTIQATGQRNFPWIEFEDGSVYREESNDMAAVIRAGKLDEKRGNAAASSG